MTRRVTVHFVRIISIVTWPTCDGDDAMTMHDNEHVCAKISIKVRRASFRIFNLRFMIN